MNSIDPKIWGPPAWDFLFYTVLAYPDVPTENDKNSMKNFFMSVGPILPCELCRLNFAKHTDTYKLTSDILSSRHRLLIWLITIHNEVRKMKGKMPVTYEYIIEKYLMKQQCYNIFSMDAKTTVNVVIILIIIMLIIFLKVKTI